ncbi:hypothetical protein N8H74_26035 [Pseudomonas sp. B2M1-30]|uniref:hypothetical protein n=1 Tax=Pseudomonas TaxID=286 RepID=UPI0021C58DD9|nr:MULTISPECIES: hypothetical protein [Pseudomonas]MCU0121735.1 hypothetical protein [Pseudomonas sp. B2M1-30]MCU7263877.1 hypothetical protein [Pseudomonas koreensis]
MTMTNESDHSKTRIDRDNRHEREVKAILRRNGKWDCLYPGCTKKSIFSHAISESISLATIAEEGHLSTIESRRKKDIKTLQFGRIGIHDATAFNGFCEEHDALFSTLDNNEISDARGLLLQTYRTVISECADESRIAALSHSDFKATDVDSILAEIDTDEHPWLQSEDGRALFIAEHAKIADADLRRSTQLMELPGQLLKKLALNEDLSLEGHSVFTTEQLSHYIPFRRLGFRIPVAINCIIPCVANGARHDFYFAVIPYQHATLVMGVVPKAMQQSLLDRLMENFSCDYAAIDLVESLMVSSNEWFMTPSVLAEMSSQKREVFLHDSTFITEQHFYEEYDMTLFDSLRRALAQQHPEQREKLRLDKIDVIPHRESFEVRHNRMLAALSAQSVELRDI